MTLKMRMKLILGASVAVVAFAGGASSSHAFGVPSLPATQAVEQDLILVTAANTQAGAKSFIEGMAQRGLDFLSNSSMSHDQKTGQFKKLLQDSFDLDTIGRFSLGRYWNTATEAQRKEYLGLFRNMIIRIYSNRFGEYKGQKFETRSARPDGDKDTIVTSFIVSQNSPEVQVDWRVRYKNGSYKIVDVIVEGVSMSVTQRSDFSSVIQRGGGDVQVLINHLKSQN